MANPLRPSSHVLPRQRRRRRETRLARLVTLCEGYPSRRSVCYRIEIEGVNEGAFTEVLFIIPGGER